ncbi:MAG: aminotransferase class V-fold PLP-dependent enzyme [Lachnospiraceae bacterium]|nr:aminotransferase class V-fold PLP-dependent enzyme [Lachnospiraceae bacterium]
MPEYLYDLLTEFCRSGKYPLHMPGHKRRLGQMEDPFSFDITEIDGFDNLHHAEGILKEAQQRAAQLFGAEETFFLVNGSTAGILSAVSCAAAMVRRHHADGLPDRKPEILMARNSHKAAYHALYLTGMEPVYLYPERTEHEFLNGCIRPENVRRELDLHPRAAAVFITSPTYDGVISDIRGIAEEAHRHGALLIVDEAHGAHFGFHPYFPESAVRQGADIVIQSVHKTLPSLTQTALLHVSGPRADREMLRRMLGIYQTSSPSYVLMASIDQCVRILREKGGELFDVFSHELEMFWEEAGKLENLEVIRTDDPSRILISGWRTGLSGFEICDILRKNYHLEPEMTAEEYVLALMSVGDGAEGTRELLKALRGIAARAEKAASGEGRQRRPLRPDRDAGKADICIPIRDAWDSQPQRILLEECAGRISAEFVYLYPPGIPLAVPGERISRSLAEDLCRYRDEGCALQGMEDHTMTRIRVLPVPEDDSVNKT